MADCSIEFTNLHNSISLSKTEKKYLRTARKAITTKISSFFMDKEQCPKVEYKGQGSFSMGTIIKPLDGEFDIDIGIYLLGQTNYRIDWPKPEVVSQWLLNALENHTSTPPINKRRCVRIKYKPIAGNSTIAYHVDLPIYCEYKNLLGNQYTRIGVTGELQWSQKTDPVGFTKWFIENCKKNQNDKNQLVRLVKYIKAWKDFVKSNNKFPSGMALTILMAKNFIPHERDDIAFKETVRRAFNNIYIFNLFSIGEIVSPVEPYNNLVSRLTAKQKENFKNCFENLVDNAKKAIEEPSSKDALLIWQEQFGNRIYS